jgi:hypothetical protein
LAVLCLKEKVTKRKRTDMEWIQEMFAGMEKDRALASVKRSENGDRVARPEHRKKEMPGALNAWNALVSSMTVDITDFNNHQERAGQTAVCIHSENLQCEIYMGGMHSKRLVLTLDNNDLEVVVHPDFPRQQLTITVGPEKEGHHGFWVLGESTQKSVTLSAAQLSEYLLKPVLSAAAINREA